MVVASGSVNIYLLRWNHRLRVEFTSSGSLSPEATFSSGTEKTSHIDLIQIEKMTPIILGHNDADCFAKTTMSASLTNQNSFRARTE